MSLDNPHTPRPYAEIQKLYLDRAFNYGNELYQAECHKNAASLIFKELIELNNEGAVALKLQKEAETNNAVLDAHPVITEDTNADKV